jgi:hypothetical protein
MPFPSNAAELASRLLGSSNNGFIFSGPEAERSFNHHVATAFLQLRFCRLWRDAVAFDTELTRLAIRALLPNLCGSRAAILAELNCLKTDAGFNGGGFSLPEGDE